MQVTFNSRSYNIVNIEAIEGALCEDMKQRGWDGNFYTLVGKRGSQVICLKSSETGEFSKAF